LVRTNGEAISREGWTELERQVMRSHRWWSVAELLATTERVFPADFGSLVEQFLRDGTQGVARIAL
jgi:hypothetical protein